MSSLSRGCFLPGNGLDQADADDEREGQREDDGPCIGGETAACRGHERCS